MTVRGTTSTPGVYPWCLPLVSTPGLNVQGKPLDSFATAGDSRVQLNEAVNGTTRHLDIYGQYVTCGALDECETAEK